MKYDITQKGEICHVSLDGQLNFAAHQDFHALLLAVIAAKAKKVVFEMSHVTGIDSVGLGLLYIAQEDVAKSGKSLCLASPRDSVARLLELTEAEKLFEITDLG